MIFLLKRQTASSWVPDLGARNGPLYLRIAGALAQDIQSGRIGPGARLPTHRSLAYSLGVTVNTVTKAYAEVERNGLVVSRTGRGTYAKDFPEELANDAALPQETINLSANTVSSEAFSPVFNQMLGMLSRRGSLHGLLEYHPHPSLYRHRAAGARWISQRGLEADPDQVIVCYGAQEAMLAALLAIARPGATVVTEQLNYTGVRHVGEILNVNLCGVATDVQGLVPDALEAACRREKVAAILVSPTNHNPTNATAPLDRRREIVEIARRAGVLLIEDDTHGHIAGHPVPPLTALAPESSIYICGLSKSIVAGLRLGYMLAPAAMVSRLIDSLSKVYWNPPMLLGEIATLLIEDGHADSFLEWHRREALTRLELAQEVLGIESGPGLPSYHLWLPLPDPWRAIDFAAEVEARGVLVAPSDKFAVDRSPAPHAVRISLGWMRDIPTLREGLHTVADTLAGRSRPAGSVR